MRQALLSTSYSIGSLEKKNESKAILCITNLFKAVSMYFDNVLTQEKAETIAVELLSKYEYRSLRLEDLVVICKQLKEGDVFKITPARVLRQVRKYSDERVRLATSINREQSDRAKANVNYQLEERVKASYKTPANINKLSSGRNKIVNDFK